MARHIAAITIVVPDYDEAIAFYVERAGFELVEDTRLSATKRWVLVTPPGGQCRVLLARANSERQHRAIGNQTGGRVGFFLTTDDFDRDYAAMTAAGVDFTEAPRREPYGQVAVFEDPFGNRWDLIEPAAG